MVNFKLRSARHGRIITDSDAFVIRSSALCILLMFVALAMLQTVHEDASEQILTQAAGHLVGYRRETSPSNRGPRRGLFAQPELRTPAPVSLVLTERTDDHDFEKLFHGRLHKKRVDQFAWQGTNLCYDADQKTFVASLYKNQTSIPLKIRNQKLDRSSVTKWLDGVTVISSEYVLDQKGAHFYLWSMPAFHMVAHARRTFPSLPVNVLFDDIHIPEQNILEKGIFEYFFSEVEVSRRLGISSLQGVTCFERVLASRRSANPAVKMVAYPEDLAYLRKILERRRQKAIVHSCQEPKANRKTIWLAQRRVQTRRIENLDAVKTTIRRVFGPEFEIIEFDSPNSACENEHGQRCSGQYSCDLIDWEHCENKRSVDHEIALFNNITFLISVHGATAMNLVWMPAGSTFVEIFPMGVTERCYEDFSKRAEINYFGFDEPNRTLYNTIFRDVPPHDCFAQNDCRWQTKKWSVHVSTDKLAETLTAARDNYLKQCNIDTKYGQKQQPLRATI